MINLLLIFMMIHNYRMVQYGKYGSFKTSDLVFNIYQKYLSGSRW